MIRNDGMYVIYDIQHRQSKPTKWVSSSFEHFGHPEGFNASDPCWQETGVMGTFSRHVAQKGLTWIRKKNPGTYFRLVVVIISQKTLAVPALEESK